MIPRIINPSKSNSFFLFGARGTGKSTFVSDQFLKETDPKAVLSLDLLLPEVEDIYAKNPERLKREVLERKEMGPLEWIFIDEVQKIPRLLDLVHHLIEKENVKFILTGSSARKLKRGSANLLAGRAFVYSLYPFSFLELGELFDLDHALHWGTLPKIMALKTDSDKEAFLRAYALTYLKEEIQMEQLVRRLDPFRSFLEVAAQCNGNILNFSAVARDVGMVDHKTVLSYFQILEDTHLGFLLPGFSRSVRKAQSIHPKFYFFDTGVKRSLEKTLDVKLKPKTYAYSAAFEHFVILEIFRLNHILARDFKLFYLNSRGTEVDLILSKPKEEIWIEIKSNSTVDAVKVDRFAKLTKDFANAQAYWLSLDPTPQKISHVHCLPWQEGLKRIFGI